MLRRIDESQFLIKLLRVLSTFLAKQRGLPIVAGIVLVVIAFIVQLVNVSLDSLVLEYLYVVVHHVGILIALIGLLLSEPLGQ